MAWQPKLQRHRRKCQRPSCGVMFQCRSMTQRWCSRRCAALALPAGFVAERGKCAGRKSGESREARALAKLRAAWPGITAEGIEAFRAIVRGQYQSGWRAGNRAGWREAFKRPA